MTDPITTRSAADVLGSAWPWSVFRRALQSVPPAPDRLAVPTVVGALFDFPNRSTQNSVPLPEVKAGWPMDEPRKVSKNDCYEDIVGERRISEERKQEEKDVRIGNMLVEGGLSRK